MTKIIPELKSISRGVERMKITFEIDNSDGENERKLVEKMARAFANQVQRQRELGKAGEKREKDIEVTD